MLANYIIFYSMKNIPPAKDQPKPKQIVDVAYHTYQKIKKIRDSDPQPYHLPSVQNFRKFINENPLVRMQFEGAIDQVPLEVASQEHWKSMRPGIFYQSTVEQVLNFLSIAAQTPPSFEPAVYSGVPFYSLMEDLMDTEQGKAFFSRSDVNAHLKCILDDYSKMLKTPKSLQYFNSQQGGWLSEPALKMVDYNEFICDPKDEHYGFKCWNDWFERDLREGARPVAGENDPNCIVHAAQNYPLTTIDLPFKNVKAHDKFWLKRNLYSLFDMFEVQKMQLKTMFDESFVGGTIYQGFLSPWCYHQWHSPISGTIEKSYLIPGSYFLQNPSYDIKQPGNYDKSQSFLTCASARHVFIIKADNELIGRVGLIYIGMIEVSSCVATIEEGEKVEKGQKIGRFQFGGSSHVMVFDRKTKLQFNADIKDREDRNGFQVSKKKKVNSLLAAVIE